ncbi:MAG: hypothetical protein AAFP70_22065, partial [Calditrichota bacterium]
HVHRTDNQLSLKWITVKDLPFPMPLEISINGETQRYEFVNEELELTLPGNAEVKIDPINWVLKKVVGEVNEG